MSKTIRNTLLLLVPIVLVLLIKPYIEEQEVKSQYSFEVDSIDGPLNNDSFKGKVLAIYFGYTFCPDVCPTSLSSLAYALDSFPKEKANNLAGLFISVDPNRDKLADLKSYAEYFHKNFKGGTSNKENIDEMVSRFGTYYKKVNLENSSMGYSVAHTSYIYFFDKEGKFIKKVDHFSNPDELKAVLKTLL